MQCLTIFLFGLFIGLFTGLFIASILDNKLVDDAALKGEPLELQGKYYWVSKARELDERGHHE